MREIRLNWYEPRQCWRVRKKIGGKTRTFYVGTGASGPSDQRAKAAALLEAEKKIREAEAEADARTELEAESHSIVRGVDGLNKQVLEAAAFFRQPYAKVIEDLFGVNPNRPAIIERSFKSDQRAKQAEEEAAALRDRVAELEALLSAQGRAAASLAVAPVAELKDKYLKGEEASLREAGRTSNHIGSLRTNLGPLLEYLEGEGIQTTADLDAHEHIWGSYRDDLLEQKQTEKRSAAWLKGRLRVAKLWAEWLVERGYLAKMPRSIGRSWSRAGTDAPSPTFLSIAECRKIFKAADDRLKLAVALGLNCGYRASDIQSLRREHFFPRKREIIRQRNKTGTAQRHRLWKATAELLKEQFEKSDEPFASGWSNIARETTELIDSAIPGNADAEGSNRRTGKSLRSTGAQAIEKATGGTMPHVVDQWLAHGDKRLAKHYRKEELAPLYRAIDKTEKAFSL